MMSPKDLFFFAYKIEKKLVIQTHILFAILIQQ